MLLVKCLQVNRGLLVLNLHNIDQITSTGIKAMTKEGLARNFFFAGTESGLGVRGTNHALEQELNFFLGLNRAGRRLLLCDKAPVTLWTRVLARVQCEPDKLHYLLRENPKLFDNKVV